MLEIVRLFLVMGVFTGISKILFILLDKMFEMKDAISLSDTEAKNIDKFGTWFIYVVIAIHLPIFLINGIEIKWFFVLLITLLWGFEAVLDWIYVRETKQYITMITFIIFVNIIALNFHYVLDFLFNGKRIN